MMMPSTCMPILDRVLQQGMLPSAAHQPDKACNLTEQTQ